MREAKIFYYTGKTMDLSADIQPGLLRLADDALEVYARDDGHHGEGAAAEASSEPIVRIDYGDIICPSENHRLHFLCRMLRIIHRDGTLFFTIPLIAALGRPVVSNSTQLVAVQDELDRRFRTAWLPSSS